MSDISYNYRQLLWKLTRETKDPERKLRMTDFLNTWEDWAAESKKEMKLLDWSIKYWWVGFLPSILVFLYASVIVGRRVQQKYNWFMIAERSLSKYNEREGANVEERAAIGALTEQVREP